MTNEEINRKAEAMFYADIHAHTDEDKFDAADAISCLEAIARFGRALVSQAYEEAAQMAESMPLRHARFDFECAQESARAIRALRDSLQPEGEVTGV